MATCPCCGAVVAEGERVCSQCGTLVEQKSQYSHGQEPVQQPVQPVQQPVQPVQQPVQQPAWAQYGGQPTGQPTFYVPKRPLGKGGAIVMIVFGAVLIAFYAIAMIVGFSEENMSATQIITLTAGLLGGGLLLLLFGIRKLRNVKRYNASLNDPQ